MPKYISEQQQRNYYDNTDVRTSTSYTLTRRGLMNITHKNVFGWIRMARVDGGYQVDVCCMLEELNDGWKESILFLDRGRTRQTTITNIT